MKKKGAVKAVRAPSMTAEDRSWRARDDLRTLTRAQEISADKVRMAAAKREAAKQQASLARISKLAGKRI